MGGEKGRRVLVIQNVAIEGPGVIGPAMAAAGWELDTRMMADRRVALPSSLRGYQVLIILGGPMNVYELEAYPYLRQVDELVAQGLERELPMLGLCLGAQILAKNMGANVVRNRVPEIGWYPVQLTPQGRKSPLFAGFPEHFPVFQWHEDRFHIPEGALHLATTDACAEQAFSYGGRVFGLQFHPEVTTPMVISWLAAYQEDLAAFVGPEAAVGIAPDRAGPACLGVAPVCVRTPACAKQSAAGRRTGRRRQAHSIERHTRELEAAHCLRAAQLARNWLAVCEAVTQATD